jgi:general secretion pathway protein N
MRARTLILLAVIAFVMTVAVRAPARWLLSSFPPTVQCVPDGTLWSGRCAPLTLSGITLSAVHWQLKPLQLLRGRFVAQLHSEDPRAIADLQAAMSRDGSGELSDITAHVDIGAGILPLFPEGWGGDLEANLPHVSLSAGQLTAVTGTITVRRVREQNPALDMGSYELKFVDPGTGKDRSIGGVLRDLGGPLSVSGRLRLQSNGEYDLSGFASARAGADDQLTSALEFLGPPDARGRRPFTLGGRF